MTKYAIEVLTIIACEFWKGQFESVNKIQPGTSFAQIVAPSSEPEIEQTQQSSE